MRLHICRQLLDIFTYALISMRIPTLIHVLLVGVQPKYWAAMGCLISHADLRIKTGMHPTHTVLGHTVFGILHPRIAFIFPSGSLPQGP